MRLIIITVLIEDSLLKVHVICVHNKLSKKIQVQKIFDFFIDRLNYPQLYPRSELPMFTGRVDLFLRAEGTYYGPSVPRSECSTVRVHLLPLKFSNEMSDDRKLLFL